MYLPKKRRLHIVSSKNTSTQKSELKELREETNLQTIEMFKNPVNIKDSLLPAKNYQKRDSKVYLKHDEISSGQLIFHLDNNIASLYRAIKEGFITPVIFISTSGRKYYKFKKSDIPTLIVDYDNWKQSLPTQKKIESEKLSPEEQRIQANKLTITKFRRNNE